MEPLKVLSIDFDVFYDLGKNFIPSIQSCRIDWTVNYNQNTDTMENTFYYDLYNSIKEKIHSSKCPIYVSEDHSYAARTISNLFPFFDLEIVNYDRHSDVNSLTDKPEILTCANWVSWLSEYHNITQYDWVCWGNDYYISNAPEHLRNCSFPASIVTNTTHRLDEEYDLIFIIQSYRYSPPHMYHRFRELYKNLSNVEFDKSSPIWNMSYADSVKALGKDGLSIYLREEDSMSIFADLWEAPTYSSSSVSTEEELMYIRNKISREEFIRLFGECDPLYAE